MVPKNILNIEKKDNIIGNVFNLFYPNIATSLLFDSDLSTPIIHGSKNIVMTQLKNIYKTMNVDIKSTIIVMSYILTSEGYRRVDTYRGPIETLGKYIRRY